jgi:outer membrane protein
MAGVACLAAPREIAAQESRARTYTLEEAVAQALANHPRLAAASAEVSAAVARIDEARAGDLPRVGVSAQLNRSTGNTVPGAFFATLGFPSVAGAAGRGTTFDGGVWQTGVSLWATWDVLSTARQAAATDVALAGQREVEAATSARRLEVGYGAAEAFLLLLEAQETARAAKASVDRAQLLVLMTRPLVEQRLRPGSDTARADAELANAHMLVVRAEQSCELRRAQLAEAVGNTSLRVDAAPGGLAGPIDHVVVGRPATSPNHPDIVESNAAIERAVDAHRLIEMEYLPRIDLVAALWMRGSGLSQSPGAGLVPDVANWAAGATVTWSFLDIPLIRARARAASATRDAAVARRAEAYLAVTGQLWSATAILDGALRIAQQTPAALASARSAEQQASARFKAGLAALVEVADSERLLTQTEIDDAIARLEVRRALLLLARASGDLGPFLAHARAGGA